MVYPTQPTLTVKVAELHRKPAISCRYTPINGFPYEGLNGEYNQPDLFQTNLWFMRLKYGGRSLIAGHGLYCYYDRFWEKNPNNTAAFEGEHPEFFARGYKGVPPQLRYGSPELVAQVAKDMTDYFKTGRQHILTGKDWCSVEPMDNASYDKEDMKVWAPNVDAGKKREMVDVSMSGKYSDYIFQFANAVQKEVSKECPDGHVFILGYGDHAFPPSFPVDPKIYVQPEVSMREWLAPGDPKAFDAWVQQELKNPHSEITCYKAWINDKKKSGRVLSMWLNTGFPLLLGCTGGFHVFPGYDAAHVGQPDKDVRCRWHRRSLRWQ